MNIKIKHEMTSKKEKINVLLGVIRPEATGRFDLTSFSQPRSLDLPHGQNIGSKRRHCRSKCEDKENYSSNLKRRHAKENASKTKIENPSKPTPNSCSLEILKHVMPSRTKLKIAKLKSFDRLSRYFWF
jgi:hypothetical protein